MLPVIIVSMAVIVVVCGIILLSLRPSHDQSLICPHCQIGFTTDLYFLQQNTFAACPFCHRWMVITRVGDKNVVKKPFA